MPNIAADVSMSVPPVGVSKWGLNPEIREPPAIRLRGSGRDGSTRVPKVDRAFDMSLVVAMVGTESEIIHGCGQDACRDH